MEAIEVLRLFNEKAEKLRRSSFTHTITTEKLGISGHQRDDGEIVVEHHGPKGESVDALVLTLRFFLQNNEPTSFQRIAELYDTLPVPPKLIQQVHEGRATINAILDSPSHVELRGKRISNREILEVFLWGDLAHASRSKRQTFDEWRSDGHFFLFEFQFNLILSDVLSFIDWLRVHNEITLKHLTGEH